MRHLTIAIGLLLTVHSVSAAVRTLELVEGAHEAALAYVTLPGSTSGTVIFRACDDCDPHSLRVTANTRYQVGGQALPLAEFRDTAEQIREGSDGEPLALVNIFYDLETGRVTRIQLPSAGG